MLSSFLRLANGNSLSKLLILMGKMFVCLGIVLHFLELLSFDSQFCLELRNVLFRILKLRFDFLHGIFLTNVSFLILSLYLSETSCCLFNVFQFVGFFMQLMPHLSESLIEILSLNVELGFILLDLIDQSELISFVILNFVHQF